MLLVILFNDISSFFGRFHPLLVHLPIGFIIVAYLFEIVGDTIKRPYLKQSVPFVLIVGGISGVFTVITGYLLSQTGGYGMDALFWHQWLAIAATILIFITLSLHKTKAYFPAFSFTVITIFVTGHLGGNITHGEAYLTEYLPVELKDVFGIEQDNYVLEEVSYEEAALYKHVVYPILHDKCIGCHNESKMKGELNMSDFESFLMGGENGKVVKKGRSNTSEVIKRIMLSEKHEDTMPPEGKERITEEEMQLITLWIDQDLKEDTYLDSLDIPKDIKEDIQFRLDQKKEDMSPVYEMNVVQASNEKLESLRTLGFSVLPVSIESPFLQITYFDRVNPLTEESKNALLAVSEQLVWLDLSGVKNSNDQWLFLQSLPNLIKLYLSNTSVNDDAIKAFSKNIYLETISLYGTSATKEILPNLIELNYLKSLYIGSTAITAKDTISISSQAKSEIVF